MGKSRFSKQAVMTDSDARVLAAGSRYTAQEILTMVGTEDVSGLTDVQRDWNNMSDADVRYLNDKYAEFYLDSALESLDWAIEYFYNSRVTRSKSRFTKAMYLSNDTLELLADVGFDVSSDEAIINDADNMLQALISLMDGRYEDVGMDVGWEIGVFEDNYTQEAVEDAKEEFQEMWDEYRVGAQRQREDEYMYGKSRSRVTRAGKSPRTNANQESTSWAEGKGGGKKTTTGIASSPKTNADQESQVWIGKRGRMGKAGEGADWVMGDDLWKREAFEEFNATFDTNLRNVDQALEFMDNYVFSELRDYLEENWSADGDWSHQFMPSAAAMFVMSWAGLSGEAEAMTRGEEFSEPEIELIENKIEGFVQEVFAPAR